MSGCTSVKEPSESPTTTTGRRCRSSRCGKIASNFAARIRRVSSMTTRPHQRTKSSEATSYLSAGPYACPDVTRKRTSPRRATRRCATRPTSPGSPPACPFTRPTGRSPTSTQSALPPPTAPSHCSTTVVWPSGRQAGRIRRRRPTDPAPPTWLKAGPPDGRSTAGEDVGEVEADRPLELVIRTRAGLAVGTPADKLRGVPEPVALHVVVSHLDDALRPQRGKGQVLLGVPPAAFVLARRALAFHVGGPVPRMPVKRGDEWLELDEQLLAPRHRKRADHADRGEHTAAVEQPEQ